MVGKQWNAIEENWLWLRLIPQSKRRIPSLLNNLTEPLEWDDLAQQTKDHFVKPENGGPELCRDYTGNMICESLHQQHLAKS